MIEQQTFQQSYIIGELLFIIFQNEHENFTIAKLKVMETNEPNIEKEVIVKGYFRNIHKGIPYKFFGEIEHHPRFGLQYNIHTYQTYVPDSKTGLVDYLTSDLFYGIGPKTAKRIVQKFGENAIQKILNDPSILEQIPHLNKEVRDQFVKTLQKNQGFEDVVTYLSNYGIGLRRSQKIYEIYQEKTLDVLKTDPYQLVFHVEGFGFHTADKIALQNGLLRSHEHRIGAACLFVLQQSMQHGHVFLPIDECINKVLTLLASKEVTKEKIREQLNQLADQEHVILTDTNVYLPSLYYAEQGVINHLQRLLAEQIDLSISLAELMKIIGNIEEDEVLSYGKDQFEAINKALHSKVMVITGGPGTGKTTVIKGILKAYATIYNLPYAIDQYDCKEDYPFILTAPTGRAAKRLHESTGLPAVTIHRLLGWNGEDYFEKNEYERLTGKFLIVDEFSMVDIWLANNLLKAIPNDMQVLFVGDEDQLPSVGPGQVLSDLLRSKQITYVQLHEVYRQKQGSKILQLAHAIKNDTCQMSDLENDKDFSFIACQEHQMIDCITQIFKKAKTKGIDLKSIQVLAPIYRSRNGIINLNHHLQQIVNPAAKGKREKKIFDAIFRVGDKVIQLVNQPEDGVYNGDIGEIVAIFHKNENVKKEEQIIIAFDEREVTYTRKDFKNFMHAYCISIHKSQGSEFPIVILPVLASYRRMMRKNLLYTAITRCKHSLIICGEKQVFLTGIQTVDTNKRYTKLAEKLAPLKDRDQVEEDVSPYDFLE